MFRFLSFSLLLCVCAMAKADVLDTVRRDLDHGHANEGLNALNLVLSSQPQNAEAYNLQCRFYLQEEQWDKAIHACQSAVGLAPENSNYHLWLGRALGEKADRVNFVAAFRMARQVRQEFETAVRLDPRNAEALSDLGEFYVDAPAMVGGGLDKAGRTAQQLEAFAPGRAHTLRARMAEEQKDFTRAEQEYKAAVAAEKDPAEAWMDLASFYRRRQRWDAMEQAVRAGAAADTRHGVALADGASVLLRAGRDLPLARQLMEQYLASPNKSEGAPAFQVRMQLSKVLMALGDPQGAQQQLAEAQGLAKDYLPAAQATNSGR
ncbi:tetratricopeptide repeat protein [Pseudacidobacterium ailaaui]|uniref:tetratricopeptide repeat protein n=1 Tax=Pseudacidobacterium ailaaui TaxID=1382359 RepID=UPI0006794545|nr:tetratricopeptide repeat protein [Pseudacidobacterium ailaaui]